MIFRGLSTTDGDWLFGAGRASFARDNDAILLNISTTLKTFLGECFYNTAVGLDWFTLINQKNKDIVLLTIKNAIYNCYGVTAVNEIEYALDENRELVLTYNITTLYAQNVIGTVTI